MIEVQDSEAERSFGALLARVESGEEVVIMRLGERIARLVPERVAPDREKARAAADAIIEMSRGVTLGGLKIKDLVNEGRP